MKVHIKSLLHIFTIDNYKINVYFAFVSNRATPERLKNIRKLLRISLPMHPK